MSYAQPSDIVSRFPNRDLVQLTNEDPTAQTVNTDYLQVYLDSASAEIDTYLESRFALPLADVPVRLRDLCIDIAIYKMQALRPLHDLEDARKRYDDALAVLKKVANGDLTLGLTADNLEPPSQADDAVMIAGGERSGIPNRLFTRGKLRGF